ncbi:MAG: HAD-IIB family hydrolase [Candidatus Binatia bacterium]
MRYLALACDNDGTLARHGEVDEATIEALMRLRTTGRRLLLVTGRQLDDLERVFPHLHLFERVVVENGAVIVDPATRDVKVIAEPPPEAFGRALESRAVPAAVGRVIVATWEPHETTVLETIRDLGLELQVIFNKGAVMVLPSGINKAAGLRTALEELALSAHNTVGIGDAENDHAFLAICECAVAVANALPALQSRCDWVTAGDHGAGVIELIDEMIATDLASLAPRLSRHNILLGLSSADEPVHLPPVGVCALLTGPSGSGKSTLATGLLERIAEQGYQFCIIDPEGDYGPVAGAVSLGESQREPSADEVLELLEKPGANVVVNLLGVKLENRPGFFARLIPRLQELRARTARPHWIVVDEAHHLLPASWDPAPLMLPQAFEGVLLITVHPDHLAAAVLEAVDTVIALGPDAKDVLRYVPRAAAHGAVRGPAVQPETGEALLWSTHLGAVPMRLRIVPPQADRRRHQRKYAAGELGEDKSFYFRGPGGRLNLRAQNLNLFAQLADGVDDETWLFHLRRGDYSRWFRESIKDEGLAADTDIVERTPALDAAESRARIRAAIEQRYTGAA